MDSIIKLVPDFKGKIWGGRRMAEDFGYEIPNGPVGECWAISAHPNGDDAIASGEYAGKTLSWLWANHRELFGNCESDVFPLLVKIIDAADDLSIQVHPDDDYAMRVEGEPGKTEMWYIMDAAPGAALYYGLNRAVSKEEFAKRIQEQTLTEILNRVEVKPGELYFIPSGTLHAIGAGILLAEIQQNSNTTYRVYDYGRRGADGKLRPLHIEKALDVTNLSPIAPTAQYPAQPVDGGSVRRLESCKYFISDVVEVSGKVHFTVGTETFRHLLALDGEAVLETASGSYPMKKGDSVLLPAGLGAYSVKGSGFRYIVTGVEEKLG